MTRFNSPYAGISRAMFSAAVTTAAVFLVGCSVSKNQLRQTLKENPDIIFEVIEKNPEKFAMAAQKASQEFQRISQQKQMDEEKAQFDADLKDPKKPTIEADRAVRGDRNAPIAIVMYSDIQCPYCKKGYQTADELMKKYGAKAYLVHKHLPLSFHPQAMPAAKRFEAIALQSSEKAWKFLEEVFKDQQKLGSGEKFLDDAAKRAGANMSKMKTDMESEKIKSRIEADMDEAQKFGIQGTPGFVVAGVVVRGAYPTSHFEQIIDKKLGDEKKN